jgi:hypothetical protein
MKCGKEFDRPFGSVSVDENLGLRIAGQFFLCMVVLSTLSYRDSSKHDEHGEAWHVNTWRDTTHRHVGSL